MRVFVIDMLLTCCPARCQGLALFLLAMKGNKGKKMSLSFVGNGSLCDYY